MLHSLNWTDGHAVVCDAVTSRVCCAWSDDSGQVFNRPFAHHLVKSAYRILLEMLCRAVRVERSVVFILLINDNGRRIALDPVRYIRHTSRFPARRFSQLTQNVRDGLAVFIRKPHTYRKADHNHQARKYDKTLSEGSGKLRTWMHGVHAWRNGQFFIDD